MFRQICIFVFVPLIAGILTQNYLANPGDIITILIPLIIFYLLSYVLLTLVGRIFFQHADAVAMVFGVVMRDLSIALAIVMTAFKEQGSTIALFIALAYVIQIQSAAWYVKLVPFLFDKKTVKDEERLHPVKQ